MTDPAASSAAATPASIPPGWYADHTVAGLMRWWDGANWTEHTAPSTAAPGSATSPANSGYGTVYTAVPERPTLPADRPVYSVFIWLIVLLPLVSIAGIFAWQPHVDISSGALATHPMSIYSSMFTPGYFVLVLTGWVGYALTAVFAYRDVAWLRRQGVVRPFPWPWVFLYSPVYVIGRSVIVHRVAKPRGRAPIWVLIAVVVVIFVATLVWTGLFFASMVEQIPVTGNVT
jgi:hypothetical protein